MQEVPPRVGLRPTFFPLTPFAVHARLRSLKRAATLHINNSNNCRYDNSSNVSTPHPVYNVRVDGRSVTANRILFFTASRPRAAVVRFFVPRRDQSLYYYHTTTMRPRIGTCRHTGWNLEGINYRCREPQTPPLLFRDCICGCSSGTSMV